MHVPVTQKLIWARSDQAGSIFAAKIAGVYYISLYPGYCILAALTLGDARSLRSWQNGHVEQPEATNPSHHLMVICRCSLGSNCRPKPLSLLFYLLYLLIIQRVTDNCYESSVTDAGVSGNWLASNSSKSAIQLANGLELSKITPGVPKRICITNGIQ